MVYCPEQHDFITPDQSIFESTHQIVSSYLAVARENEQGAMQGVDAEFLHNYRVSLRRIRSLLSLFRGVYDEKQCRCWRSDLSVIMKKTNRLRDLEVCLMDRDQYYSLIPEGMHPGLDILFTVFEKERTGELASVGILFQSLEYSRRMSALEAAFQTLEQSSEGEAAQDPTPPYANTLIIDRYLKVAVSAATVNPDMPDERFHELRIECKKLRYLMEFFAALYPDQTIKPLIKSLKRLQDFLGKFNDYSVQRDLLITFVEDHRLQGTTTFQLSDSIDVLIKTISRLKMDLRSEVEREVSEFVNERTRENVQKLCGVEKE